MLDVLELRKYGKDMEFERPGFNPVPALNLEVSVSYKMRVTS